MPEKETSYTREGTIAHAMAERILKYYLDVNADFFEECYPFMVDKAPSLLAEEIEACKAEGLDWKEMAEMVYNNYCRSVYESYLGALMSDPEAVLMVEARLVLAQFIPQGFGSSDAVLIYDNMLEVFDLKYGKGVKVDATENTQMMCYALGAYCGPGELYDIRHVTMNIIQPRLCHESSWRLTVPDLLHWAHNVLKPAAFKAYKGEGEQTPGEHCRFCKVAPICKALKTYTLAATEEKKEPGLMTIEELAQLLPHFSTIKSWISSVEEYALAAALAGYKVVEGRSVRKISDVCQAVQRLTDAGFEAEDYYRPRELKTITDLEKTLTKKGFKTILGDLVVKPEGKPTLVEETDPREPYTKAKTDFKDIIENI